MNKKYHGVIMVVLAALCFSTGGLLHKIIPWGPLAINGTRNLIASLVVLAYIKKTRHKIVLNKTVMFGAFFMFGVTTLFTIANKMTTAGSAIVLQYTAPIWILIFMFVFFGKKPTKQEIITIAVVLIGILFFFFDSITPRYLIGNIVALLSGIFYAGVFMLNEFEDGDALSSVFLGQLSCGILFTPFVSLESNFASSTLAAIFVLGFLQVGLAYIFFSEGIKHTNPVTASIITAIEPILNPLWVWIFWGEKLGSWSLAGGAVVVVAVVAYNVMEEKNHSA